MSFITKNSEKIFRTTGLAAMYLLPLVGIAGIIATVIIGQINFLILSTYLIVPLLLVSVIFRSLRKQQAAYHSLPESSFRLLLVAFMLCYTVSLILLTFAEVRPLLYYLAIVTMAVTILLEILGFETAREKTALILLQITGLMLNLNWGVTFKYFQFIGRTDVMYHTQYLNSLLQTGHVTEVFFDYQPFPLWHILNAALYLIGGSVFSTDKVIAFASGLLFLCLPVLAYLITLRLFKDQKLALIAALVSFFFPDMAYFTMSGISRSIASLLFVFLTYLVIDEKTKHRLLLISLVTAAIIVYHSISIIFVVLILFSIYLMQKILVAKEERFRKLSLLYLGATVAATLAYWYFFGSILLKELYGNIIVSAPSGVLTRGVIYSPISEAFNYMQFLPAVLFVLIGLLFVLTSKKFNAGAKIFALAALIFMWITFPGPQYLINKLMYNFGIDRFAEYTYPLLIIVSAVGIGALFYRSNKYVRAGLILLFAIWVMLSVSNDWVASDNPLVKRPFYTYYLTQDEAAGFTRIAQSAGGLVMADYIPLRYLDSSPYDAKANMLEISANTSEILRSGPDDVMIIRYGELARRPLKVSVIDEGNFVRVPQFDTYQYVDSSSGTWNMKAYDRVYDSASVGGYR